MYVCTGLVFACSGYLIPQLENPVNNTSLKKMGENGSDLSSPKNHDVGFGISPEEGSWVGNETNFFDKIKVEIISERSLSLF